MRIDDFVELSKAKLLNSPSIQSFSDICFDINKLNHGDLFVVDDHTLIQEALQKGAYALLHENKCKISDKEIAWIRTTSIKNSLLYYIRYKNINKKIFHFKLSQYEILKSICTDEEITFVGDDLQKNWNKILKSQKIIITKNETLKEISTKIEQQRVALKIIKKTLFYTTFIYENTIYNNIHIPKILLEDLEYVLAFMQNQDISYDISKLKLENSFGVCFVDKYLNPVPFGKTARAIIFEQDKKEVQNIIDYIHYHSKHTKQIVILPKEQKEDPNILYYANQNEIMHHLTNNKFNYAIINSKKKYLINTLKEQKPKQENLFSFEE